MTAQYGNVLGADLKNTALGRVSKVQDLRIPAGPALQPLKALDAIAALTSYVADRASPQVAEKTEIALRQLLDALRRSMADLSDAAELLLAADGVVTPETESAVSSFFTLVELAGFHCNRPAPLRPAALNSFDMKVSVDGVLDAGIFGGGGASHPLIRKSEKPPDFFPHILVAFRGTGVDRDSGLLLGAKIRSLETYYLGWLNDPIRFGRKLLARRKSKLNGGSDDCDGASLERNISAPEAVDAAGESAVVRRVFPSAKFSGWEGAAEFLLPVFSQEPAHKLVCVAYRKFTPDSARAREAKKKQAIARARVVAARLVNPTQFLREGSAATDADSTSSSSDARDAAEEQVPGEVGPVRIELWKDVPWGHLLHFLPPFAAKLAPGTRDMLRVDFLTFAGLASVVVTTARGSEASSLLWAQLLGTVVVYAGRIALRLRDAVSKNRGLIAEERGQRLCAADGAAVGALVGLAVQQQFGVAASMVAAAALDGFESAPTTEEVQRAVFRGKAGCGENEDWGRRLVRWGVLREDLTVKRVEGWRDFSWE
jgi:hypothetical protein